MRFQRLSIGSWKLPVCMSSLGCVLAGAFLAPWGVPQQAWASPAATTTTLTVTSGGNAVTTVTAGSVVTLTATVTVGGTPTTPGQVNFCDATAKYCTDIHLLGTAQLTANGTATLKLRPGVGSHSYKAVLAEPASLEPSASTASPLTGTAATVTAPVATTTYLESSGIPNIFSLTAAVPGDGNALPTGMVSFLDTSNGNAVLGTTALTAETGFGFAVSSLFPATASQNTPNSGGVVLAADFNGDGIPDLVVFFGGGISVLLGNGDGTFTAAPQPPISGGPGAISVGDFNGDGIPDLAVTTDAGYSDEGFSEGSSVLLLGKGDGTFNLGVVNFENAGGTVMSNSIVAGDFNGDGKLDLVEASQTIGQVGAHGNPSNAFLIVLGNGDGTFTAGSEFASVPPPSPVFPSAAMAVGDFNGDGHLDLAVTNPNLTILLGNGEGNFTPTAASPATGGNPSSIAVADFNGDGHLDLAVTNPGSNNVTILLGNGDGAFTPAASPATGTAPTSVAVGDFNGDGVPDLAVANAGSSTVTILLGNGDGTFTAAASPAADTGSTAVSVADFNGDGKEDIVVANSADSSATALVTETALAIATVNNISPAGVGTHLVKAVYSGDANYGGSTSANASLTVVPPGITLTGTPVTIALPGASGTSTITITPTNGFSGSVTVECVGASTPAGANVSDAPTCMSTPPVTISGNAPATTMLSIQTQPGTAPAQYLVNVETMDSLGVTTAHTDIAVTVNAPPPGFLLTNTAVNIASPGASGTSTLTVTPNGFSGTVTLACVSASIPSDANSLDAPTCSSIPPLTISKNAPLTAILSIQTQPGTTPVQYIEFVKAFDANGVALALTDVAVKVNALPASFALTNTPVRIASPGASGTSTITVTPSGGFLGNVTLSCAVTGSPTGAVSAPTCSVAAPAAIAGTSPATATLTVNTQAATTPGAYTVTVTGNSGTLTATTSVPVSVLTPPSFSLSNTAVAIVSPGASGTSTISVSPSGGFLGNVTLTCALTGTPTGASNAPTCSVSAPVAISGNSTVTATLTVYTSGASAAAPYIAAFRNGSKRIVRAEGSLSAITALLIFGISFRRRRLQTLLSLLLFAFLAGAAIGCGGGGATKPTNAGTTPGSYAVTVTGSSGLTVATTAVTVIVN
jgi:trimeric autotransporter adhesin